MLFSKKKEIIKKYYNTKRLNYDIFSETYRGGMNKNLYQVYKEEEIKKKRKNYVNSKKNKKIDMYIHIPFCYNKCKYCDYYKIQYQKKLINKYLLHIYEYLENYKKLFDKIQFKGLYIGGGTPSILSDKQLDKLFSYLFKNFKFIKNCEKTFEINPYNINYKKIKIIKKYGFNRVSIGIQSTDINVLKSANRGYQKNQQIEKVVKYLQKENINNINFDIIVGLNKDNIQKFDKTLEKAYNLNPSTLTLYRLLPTDKYLKEHYKGNKELFNKIFSKKIKKYHNYLKNDFNKRKKFKRIQIDPNNGYKWMLTKNKNNNISTKYNDFGINSSLFGIGPSARSHINGKFNYKTINSIKNFNKKNKYKYIGNKISKEDEISLATITNLMYNNKINIKNINNTFNIDFLNKYEKELKHLENNKIIKKREKKIILKNIKFHKKPYYSIFFLDDKNILKKQLYYIKKKYLSINFKSLSNQKLIIINGEAILDNQYQIDSQTIKDHYTLNTIIKKTLEQTKKKNILKKENIYTYINKKLNNLGIKSNYIK